MKGTHENNNNLLIAAKANYVPYKIDFPDCPTGGFTNGQNIADFIGPNFFSSCLSSPFLM